MALHTVGRPPGKSSASASLAVLGPLALSAVLLANAGPLLGTIAGAARAGLGLAPGRALVVRLDGSTSARDSEHERRFRAQLLQRVELLRGNEALLRAGEAPEPLPRGIVHGFSARSACGEPLPTRVKSNSVS